MRKAGFKPFVIAPRPSVGPQILGMVLHLGMVATLLAVSSNRALFWPSVNTRTKSSGEASRVAHVNSNCSRSRSALCLHTTVCPSSLNLHL